MKASKMGRVLFTPGDKETQTFADAISLSILYFGATRMHWSKRQRQIYASLN